MCKAQCILALMVMSMGLVHSSSWEFITAEGKYLEFYYEGMRLYKTNITAEDISKITLDPVGNRMFFFDNDNEDTLISTYDLTTFKTEPLVPRSHENERVEGIAYDPVEQILFWNVYYNSSIYWISLKSGAQNNVNGNFLIGTSNQGTSTIAIDSCNGYIYWTSIDEVAHKLPSLIERARFDGTGREVVIDTGLQMPERLVIDPQTQRLYWSDGTQRLNRLPIAEKHFTIKSSDLNGKNRAVIYSETELDQPVSLAISKDSLYWSHYFKNKAWKLPKIPSAEAKPELIPMRAWDEIVTNYQIKQQVKGVQGCERLKSLSDKIDDSLCHNYCLHGNCSVSDEVEPQCRCAAGYSGQRCEVHMCQGYCLNNGECSLNEKNAPVCKCRKDFEGQRCEISACLNRHLNKHFQAVSMLRDILNTDVKPGARGRGVKSTCPGTNF